MCSLAQREEVEKLGDIVASAGPGVSMCASFAASMCSYRKSELCDSSLKLALMAALSFCTTARSSAMVLAARTLRMNCLTVECEQRQRMCPEQLAGERVRG